MTAFECFFENGFKERLEAVGDEPGALSNGTPLSEASWDRKAAFLVWDAIGRPASSMTIRAAPAKTGLNSLAADIFKDLLG